MSTFTDDFERPDGGIGNNWTAGGTVGITSGAATFATGASIKHVDAAATGRQEGIASVTYAVAGDLNAGIKLKTTASDASGYSIGCTGTLTVPAWKLYRCATNGATTQLASVTGPAISAGTHTLRYLYENGIVTLWVDGYLIARALDSTWDANTLGGWHAYTGGALLEEITFYNDETVSFSVDPDVIPNYNNTTALTFTGVGTAWTSGTPGSPTFTCDHGSLSSQSVASATSASATYTPGSFLGTVTFLDPSTGATCTAVVTNDPDVVPPADQCPFDEDFVTTANATVLASNRGLPTLQSIIVPAAEGWGNVYLQEAIADLWYSHFRPEGINVPPTGTLDRVQQLWFILNGAYEVPTTGYTQPSAVPIVQMLEALGTEVDDIRTVNDWTLGSVINEVRGTSNRTVTEVYDLVDALTGGDNSDVLAWLDTYLGTTGPTLAQLGTMISDLATISGYTLGDVLDAIAAIPGVDLTPITNKLTAIQPNAAYTLSTIAAQSEGLATSLGTINDKLDALADAVAAIPTDPVTGGAPVWPGVADVTLGTPVALTAQLALDGPMHGVLVNVTVPPTHSGRISLGGQLFDYKSGEIAFVSDNGFIEPWQYIGWRQGLYTPKSMSQASSALFRVLSGCEGTARTFIRS